MNARNLFYSLPTGLRFAVRRLYHLPSDTWDAISGKRHEFQPPKGLIYTGAGDFIGLGKRQLGYLKNHAGLKEDHRVLDVGSGIGRTAAALSEFLDKDGSYEGFDVVEMGVKWCTRKISAKHPHFKFRYVPLGNDLYNKITEDASKFQFPYGENEFDVVFLFSVFTHMQIPEIGNYFHEIGRVLKPGGTCLATFFTYDDGLGEIISEENHPFRFKADFGNYKLMNEKVKSANIAIKQSFLKEMVAAAGLEQEQLIPGYWSGEFEKQENDFQDIVVLRKT